MRALDRKLLRDVWHMKSQALAIALVMACGMATFVMSLTTLGSLERLLDDYYDRYRFAQVFTSLKRAPATLARRMAEIPGVAAVQTRIVAEVTLDLRDMPEPAAGRLVSLPRGGQPALNRLHLVQGRLVDAARRGEAVISAQFAEAHRLQPGDRLTAVLNGRRQSLLIVGIALSPEFVYQIRPGELIPDNRRYAIVWMNDAELAAAFDLEGAFNDVSLTLMRGAGEQAVIERLDRLTAPYGGQGAYGRRDQLSHRLISDELTQLRGMALIPPSIFLAVAAFLLNVVVNRMISTQREQIATLKAFGYTRLEVAWHYLKFVLLIVALGTLLGSAAGGWFGQGMTALYARFFRFPFVAYHFAPEVALLAFLVSTLAALFGVSGALHRAADLPPAEAMRPEPPPAYRPTVIERLGLQRLLSQGVRIVLRQIERRPLKAFFSSLGIALAVAILILGSFSEDLFDFVVDFQFFRAQRQDITVSFVEPLSGRSLAEIRHLPGVVDAEPLRMVPARLSSGHRSRRLALTGLAPAPRLFRVIDRQGRPVPLPEQGLALSAVLGEILDVRVGEQVQVEVLEGKRPTLLLPVVRFIDDYAGTWAYLRLSSLNRIMGEEKSLSGAFLAVDAAREEELFRRLKSLPKVAGVTLKRGALESFLETVAENLLQMRIYNIVFASIIAFGVVYNSMRIALSERGRELATLRVLGFSRAEITWLLLGELALLVVVAIPAGLVLGYWISSFAIWALQTESQRFPLVIAPATYGYAALVILVASALSGVAVAQRLRRLDLVAVLKSRE